MSLTVDGTSIVFDGTVTIVNGTNTDNGTAYLILTPKGGFGSMPFMATGAPGLPPVFDSITMVEVNPAQTLPTPNPVVNVVSAGGPGAASHLTMTFYIHSGAAGEPGSFTIASATDLASSPALGSTTDGYILQYQYSTKTWVPVAMKVGSQYIPTAIQATAFNANSPRTLASVTVPAQPFNWRPRCFASTVVTGSVDTRVDLIARVNDQNSGDQIGKGKGIAGATPPPNTLIPAAPGGSAIPGTYGMVTAGNSATIYLTAVQQAVSINSWSTPSDPDTTFWVEVQPL